MRRILQLTSWNWHMASRQLAVAYGLMALVQAVLLLWQAVQPANAAASFAGLFTGSLCPFVFAAGYLAVAVLCQRALAQASGRSRAAYTVLTFRLPRSGILLAQVLCTALGLVSAIAFQVVFTYMMYLPVTTVQLRAGAGLLRDALLWPGRFWWEMNDNALLWLLLPTSLQGLARLALYILGPAVLLPAVYLHHGWRRIAAGCMAGAGAVCCLRMVAASLARLSHGGAQPNGNWDAGANVVLLVLMVLAWLWSVYDLNRGALVG